MCGGKCGQAGRQVRRVCDGGETDRDPRGMEGMAWCRQAAYGGMAGRHGGAGRCTGTVVGMAWVQHAARGSRAEWWQAGRRGRAGRVKVGRAGGRKEGRQEVCKGGNVAAAGSAVVQQVEVR